jgi:hypothetical protein
MREQQNMTPGESNFVANQTCLTIKMQKNGGIVGLELILGYALPA